ncbi:MAG: lamin tail domain-containing protein [Anaerolineales bacterium]|nr:lamin tail domain-containing protein [Anaerolineales bacterium]
MIGKPWRELNAVVVATLLLLGSGAPELTPDSWSTSSQAATEDRLILSAGAPGVSISEFMAAPNDTAGSDALRDEDGAVVDWIEIQNPGATAADLSGWYLTDRSDELDRWRFPAGTRVRPYGYLVVMASGKDRRDNPLWLHTNFSLRREGEYLALVSPAGTIVSSFAPEYPVQYTGVAFGYERFAAETGDEVLSEASYLRIATPGAANPIYHGPSILAVRANPDPLSAQQNLLVTATLAQVDPVTAVMLHYRFGFGPELTAMMNWHGDNNYSAEIPTVTQSPGALVRYYVTATGSERDYAVAESRWPLPCRRPALPYRPSWRLTQVWLPEIHVPAKATLADPDVIRCPAYEGTVVGSAQVEETATFPCCTGTSRKIQCTAGNGIARGMTL